MRKPKDLKSKSVFMGKFWIVIDDHGGLTIMPRIHHSSNAGTPARIEIEQYNRIRLQLSARELGKRK